jgi:hypothetical protein
VAMSNKVTYWKELSDYDMTTAEAMDNAEVIKKLKNTKSSYQKL